MEPPLTLRQLAEENSNIDLSFQTVLDYCGSFNIKVKCCVVNFSASIKLRCVTHIRGQFFIHQFDKYQIKSVVLELFLQQQTATSVSTL